VPTVFDSGPKRGLASTGVRSSQHRRRRSMTSPSFPEEENQWTGPY
jgi:hypothetical protein